MVLGVPVDSHTRLQLKAGLEGLGIVWLPKVMVEDEIQKDIV